MDKEKQKLISDSLEKLGCDCFILFDEPSVSAFTNMEISDNAVLLFKDEILLTADMRYLEAARHLDGVTVVPLEKGLFDLIGEIVKKRDVKAVAVDEAVIPLSYFRRLSKVCRISDGNKALSEIKAYKTPSELIEYKKAQAVTDRAFTHILNELKEGVTECEIAAEIDWFFKTNGCTSAFETIVLFGSKTSVPHGVPSNVRLKNNMPVQFDFGARYNGFCSDMSRAFFFGKNPPDHYRKAWEVVFEAQKTAFENMKAGMTGKEIDSFARAVIDGSDFKGGFTHSLGHGIGHEIHEWPNFSPKSDYPVPSRSLISNEPGIYLPGRFGVRTEDMVFLTEDGAENLTKSPKNILF